MTPERVGRAKAIFAAALKLEADARRGFVEETCQGDAELRNRVEALLSANEHMGRFFEHGALESSTGEGVDYIAATKPISVHEISQAQFYPGERLGNRFVIVQFLAAGGMGEVYEVIDEHLQGKHFALKTLRPTIAAVPEMRQRFEREVIIAGEVNHPNVCPTHDIFHLDGPRGPVMCLTMRLIRGESMAARLTRLGRIPLAVATPIIRQMAAGLDAAHAAGVIHRDFKPGNVMLEHRAEHSHVWITDFGVSRIFDSDYTASPIGQITGTRGYIAPELFEGRSASPCSDVYAFGVVIYEMLTGRHLAGRPSPGPIKPSTLADEIPPIWDRIVLGCLELDPKKRFGSAGEALALLDSPAPARTPGSEAPNRESGWLRSWWWRIGAAILFTIVMIGWASRMVTVRSRPTGMLEDGKSSSEWLDIGKNYLQHRDRKGSIENAIQALRKAVGADAQNAAAWAALAEAYLYQYQVSPDSVSLNLALSSASKAEEANPYLAAAHTAKGRAELAAGERGESLKEVQKALALDSQDSAAYMARGDIYVAQKKYEEAEKDYRQGLDLARNDWYADTRFGMFLQAQGRQKDAVTIFQRAKEIDPGNAMVNRNLGIAYFSMGNYDEAASAYQRALETNPSAMTYTNLGTLFFFQGRYQESVDAFERAVKLDSNRYRVWANLADAYRWTPGNETKANEAYQRAIRLIREGIAKAPDDVNLTSQLATFLAKSGKKQESLAEIANVKSGQPPSVLVRAAIVEELCGNRVKALAWLRDARRAGYPAKELDNEPEFMQLRKDPEYYRLSTSLTKGR